MMIESNEFVLVLAIYTAILLLVIFYVYPYMKKFFKRRISISIQIHAEEKKEEEAKEKVKQPQKQEEFPSILGKTKFVLCQPLPNASTDLGTENRTKKEDTFASESKKPEDKNVNLETGEGVEVTEENEGDPDVDINGELHDLGAGTISEEEASGIDFNKLGRTAKAVSNPESNSPEDEEMAGKILSENKYTGLVKSMQDDRPEYAKRITELIERHDRILAEGQNREVKVGRKKQKLYESEDFKNFNIDDIS